jgi:hypothetical protein
MDSSVPAPNAITAVPRTAGSAVRGHPTHEPHAVGPAERADADLPAHGNDPAGRSASRAEPPYPWDRNRDGWVDDPARFLEHADALRAALAAAARDHLAEQRAVEATTGATTAGAVAAATRPDVGHAHAAVALANATAVASRASFPGDPATRRTSHRSRAVPEVTAPGGPSGHDVRRQYRSAVPVPAIASRYL